MSAKDDLPDDVAEALDTVHQIRKLKAALLRLGDSDPELSAEGRQLFKSMGQAARRARLRIEARLLAVGVEKPTDYVHIQLLMQIEDELQSDIKAAN